MMEIKDIEKLAELAKIDLSDKEKEVLLKDMDGILDYVKQIESVDLPAQAGVPVDYTQKNVWREDVPASRVFSREQIISQFPDSKDDFVKVKKIM